MRRDGRSDSYISKARGMLYQIFQKAEANDLVRHNPVRLAEKMRASGTAKRKEAFTTAEVAHLMKVLPDDRMGLSIRLLLGTGMRMQELLALEPQFIEEDGSVIHIRQAVKVVKGTVSIGSPKSKDSIRDIPVPLNVRPCAIKLRDTTDQFIWESPKTGLPCNPTHFRDVFRKSLEEAGDVRLLTPHSCRHTYVSQMQALGVDIPEAYEPFVALATMAVVFWGLQYAYDRVRRRKEHDKEKRPAPSVHIEGSYNTVVQLVAEHVDMSQEKVERALNEALFNDRAKVAKAATDFVRPAKFRNSSISVIGAPEVTRETVAEVPSDAEMAKTSEVESIRLNEVLLSIRGTDRDNHQAGWRALIENDDRFPKRLPLVLSPAINLEDLANHVRVEANVVVEVERFFDGNIIPRRIHLVEYRPLSD
jgi:integrase